MNIFILFYIIFTYLFEIGAGIEGGSSWYNFAFAPILFPMKLGKYLAVTIKK